jgi:predicted DNA-binding protein YlxM (UPF0122 family)
MDKFCQKVLKKHWPNVPIVEDVNDVETIMNEVQRYSDVVQLYESGVSIQGIADLHNVTRQAMWKILQRRGAKFRDNKRHGEDNHFYRGGSKRDARAADICEKAIEDGILIPQPCEVCGFSGELGNGRRIVHAHHDDYNYPEKVRWLCQKHHYEWHKTNSPIELASELPCMDRREISKLGGKNSWKNSTPEQREERSRRMLDARWMKGGNLREAQSVGQVDLLTGGFP